MKITDNCPETQGASMQAFHPPLFKHSSKQRAAMRQDPPTELWPECFVPPQCSLLQTIESRHPISPSRLRS